MIPMLGGKVEEGEQRLAVLGQTGDCLVVLGAIFVGEHVDRGLGRRACRGAIDLTQIDLHVDLDREGDLVQHVGRLVNPDPMRRVDSDLRSGKVRLLKHLTLEAEHAGCSYPIRSADRHPY